MSVWMVFWAIFGLLLLAAAAAALAWLLRNLMSDSDRGAEGRGRVRQELDMRYARGELSREDYLQRRADLIGDD